MGSRSHDDIVLPFHRGLWGRTGKATIDAPEGFLALLTNMEYTDEELITRRNFLSLVSTVASPVRFYRFGRSTGAARYIWLDSSGNLYDTGASSPGTPIIAAATSGWGTPSDFSMSSAFDRAYITPHNRAAGIPTSFLWVYNPDWTGVQARKAAGVRPNTAALAGTTAAGGNCEPGLHIVAVSFETTSGFVTKFGATVLQFTVTAANRTINLTSVPTGTANVVTKRHILMTKVIPNFDGNVLNYEFFYVGTINDNTTTTFSINKFDSELVRSGDYLEDLLEEIPATIAITEYASSLCIGGESANPSYIRISIKGDYESFAETDGFVPTDPTDGRGVRTIVSDGDVLRFFKSTRAGFTVDNGGPPNTWPVRVTDGDQGCEFLGVGRLFESGQVEAGVFVVGNGKGLYLFDGALNSRPLSFYIDRLWQNAATGIIQIAVDTQDLKIWCMVGPSNLFMADYSKGLDAESIRWTLFTVAGTLQAIQASPSSILLTNSVYNGISKADAIRLITPSGSDHWLGGTVYPQAIAWPGQPKGGNGQIYHFSEWRVGFTLYSAAAFPSAGFVMPKDERLTQADQTINTSALATPQTLGSTISAEGGMLSFGLSSPVGSIIVWRIDAAVIFAKLLTTTGIAQ